MSVTLLTPVGATGLVAIDKPAGALVIPGRGEEGGPCLRDLLAKQLGREVWVVHRIDWDTTGVLLFALDAASHREASLAFEHGEVEKRYVALVQGRVTAPLDIALPLASARKQKMRVALPGEQGKEARTLVRPRQVFEQASLVECEPLTGRQHQIRVHLRAKGHPLLFDHQYGRREPLTAKESGERGTTSCWLARRCMRSRWRFPGSASSRRPRCRPTWCAPSSSSGAGGARRRPGTGDGPAQTWCRDPALDSFSCSASVSRNQYCTSPKDKMSPLFSVVSLRSRMLAFRNVPFVDPRS